GRGRDRGRADDRDHAAPGRQLRDPHAGAEPGGPRPERGPAGGVGPAAGRPVPPATAAGPQGRGRLRRGRSGDGHPPRPRPVRPAATSHLCLKAPATVKEADMGTVETTAQELLNLAVDYLVRLPALLVWVVGLVVCVACWRRHPRGALLVLLAMAGLLL